MPDSWVGPALLHLPHSTRLPPPTLGCQHVRRDGGTHHVSPHPMHPARCRSAQHHTPRSAGLLLTRAPKLNFTTWPGLHHLTGGREFFGVHYAATWRWVVGQDVIILTPMCDVTFHIHSLYLATTSGSNTGIHGNYSTSLGMPTESSYRMILMMMERMRLKLMIMMTMMSLNIIIIIIIEVWALDLCKLMYCRYARLLHNESDG